MIEGIEFEMPEQTVTTSGLLQGMQPAVGGFASVGGYQKVKDFLDTTVIAILKHPDLAARLGLSLPRGILLFGPPGTGKSLLTRALAAELNLPIFRLATENLFRCSWGYSITQKFGDTIKLAESRGPAIVHIGQIDKLLRQRPRAESDGASREASREMRELHNLFVEWLNERDRQSIVVGTTNRPEDIDVAVLKRVDYLIPMLYPDAEARRDILMVHLGLKGGRPVPLAVMPEQTEGVIDILAKETEYFSGAEVEQLVNKAKRLAFTAGADTLTAEHLCEALRDTNIDREQRRRDVEHYLCLAREYSTDSDLL